jgi:hypothetical protein
MSETTETVTTDNTSADAVAGETVGTDDALTLDDLMGLSQEDDPAFLDDAQHKGMKPIAHWVKNVPEDVRKHLANIRADYTRKTQELSRLKAEVEQSRAELYANRNNVLNGPLAQQLKNIDVETKHDLWDEEGMKAEINRQAQLLLRQMLEPAQQEIEASNRRLQLENFKAEHPELADPTYKDPIITMLKERPELKLEDAFYIVKAKIDSARLDEEKKKASQQKTARKETALKSSGGSKAAVTGTPQFKNAIDAYNYWKAQGR